MEYQLTPVSLENRPVRYELWIYDDVIVEGGAVQIGSKKIKQKININSNSSVDIMQHISVEDWQSGKAVVVGVRDFQPGDVEEILTKEYSIEFGEQIIKTGKITIFLSTTRHLTLNPDEYTGVVPNITVSKEIVDIINNTRDFIRLDSIIDGKLKIWQ